MSYPVGRLLRVVLPADEPRPDQDLRLLAVEIFEDGVMVRYAKRGGTAGPESPEEAALMRNGVTLSDDVGTRYEVRGGSAAGDDQVAHGLWAYAPPPPPEARRLTALTWQGPVDFQVID